MRVLTLRGSTRCRRFPGRVELLALGPDGDVLGSGASTPPTWVYGDDTPDHALRVDVLVRLLTDCCCRAVTTTALAHVRPGPHEAGDLDIGWAAAARTAADIAGVRVSRVVIVSRWGWLDLETGDQRTWVRLREPSRGW